MCISNSSRERFHGVTFLLAGLVGLKLPFYYCGTGAVLPVQRSGRHRACACLGATLFDFSRVKQRGGMMACYRAEGAQVTFGTHGKFWFRGLNACRETEMATHLGHLIKTAWVTCHMMRAILRCQLRIIATRMTRLARRP